MASPASEAPLWAMVSAEMASDTCAARARTRSRPASLLVAMISSASTMTSASVASVVSVMLIVCVCPAAISTPVTTCVA